MRQRTFGLFRKHTVTIENLGRPVIRVYRGSATETDRISSSSYSCADNYLNDLETGGVFIHLNSKVPLLTSYRMVGWLKNLFEPVNRDSIPTFGELGLMYSEEGMLRAEKYLYGKRARLPMWVKVTPLGERYCFPISDTEYLTRGEVYRLAVHLGMRPLRRDRL